MLNLIRMNLYRMFRTRSIIILFALTFSFGLLAAYMETVEMKEFSEVQMKTPGGEKSLEISGQEGQEEQKKQEEQERREEGGFLEGFQEGFAEDSQEESADFEFGIYVNPPVTENGKPASLVKFLLSDISSGIVLLFVSIGTVLFINGEKKSGFLKNIAGQTRHKANIYLSKLVVLALYTLLSILLYCLGQGILLMLHYKGDMVFGLSDLGELLPLFGLQFLLHLAFVSAVSLLTLLTGSSTIGITVAILDCCGVFQLLTGFIALKFDWNPAKYLLINNIKTVALTAAKEDIWRALAVGLCFLVIYTALGAGGFVKKDVV